MKQITLGMVWNIDGHRMEVTKMFKNGKVQITETWISEDTWKGCKSVANYKVTTDENGKQYAYDPKYEEHANPGSSEYKWWARKYADGADFAPEQETETNNTQEEDKKMTKAQEFTFNGVTYKTNEQGNYFYKSTGKMDKKGNPMFMRIPQKVFDKAWEDSGEAEKAKRDAIQAKQDAETEKTFKKEAKQSKPRKSKDVALEYRGITLTAKQVAFIKAMPEDNFYENGLDSTLWIDVFCDTVADRFSPMAVGAMVSTLKEKGLLTVTAERVNGRKAKSMQLTDAGQQVAIALGLN